MKVIGARIWLMVKELILIREVLNMLESGRMTYKMVMDSRNGQMVLNIKFTIFCNIFRVITRRERKVDKVYFILLMDHDMKVNFWITK